MAVYEGKWRCLRCAAVNRGRNLNCLSCGVKRSEDAQFFLEDDAPELNDEQLLQQARAGADWICLYCGTNCRAAEKQCSGCGGSRSAENRQLAEETRGVGDWTEAAQKATRIQNAAQHHAPPNAARKPFFSRRLIKFGLFSAGAVFAGFIALFAALVYISTLSYAVEMEVSGLEWKRTIALEEYKTVTETAWEGEVPPEARVQSSEDALHHTDKIATGTREVPETYTEQVASGTERYACGQTSKKNGYFEDKYCTRTTYRTVTKTRNRTETVYKDIPVYKTRYTYLIDKWIAAGEKTTSGTDFNPQWSSDFKADNVHLREAERTETYSLLCKELGGNNKLHKFEIAPEKWSKFQNGQHLRGKVDFFGDLISIDETSNGELKAEK